MACVKKRRGKWVVDYRDAAGIRHWVTCQTKTEADGILADKLKESRQPTRPSVDPNIRLGDYAADWLRLRKASLKPATLESYGNMLDNHIVPAFGSARVRHLGRRQLKGFLVSKLEAGLKPNTVRIMLATLRVVFNAAVDDEVISKNPADRLGRELRLTARMKAAHGEQGEEVKALDREQRDRLLEAAQRKAPRHHALFFLMSRTGLRIGEALGLQWQDLDCEKCEILIQRTLSPAGAGTPKTSGSRRVVDMSLSLRDLLRRLDIERKEETLKNGWGQPPPWLFVTTNGTPCDRNNTEHVFKRVLKAAGLPGHYTQENLRHTYASLLLQQGEPLVYVQRQLGHASIRLTADTYGRWLPLGNRAAVDRLDAAPRKTGAVVVAEVRAAAAGRAPVAGDAGPSAPAFVEHGS